LVGKIQKHGQGFPVEFRVRAVFIGQKLESGGGEIDKGVTEEQGVHFAAEEGGFSRSGPRAINGAQALNLEIAVEYDVRFKSEGRNGSGTGGDGHMKVTGDSPAIAGVVSIGENDEVGISHLDDLVPDSGGMGHDRIDKNQVILMEMGVSKEVSFNLFGID